MYDIEKLRALLITEEYKTVDEKGRCFPPSNDIYKRISIAMNGNPTSKHVYTIIKNNRNAMYETILNAFDIKNTSLDVDCSFDPNASSFTMCKDKFNLLLTFEEWKQIETMKTEYKDGRNYLILQPGWTDLFAEKI